MFDRENGDPVLKMIDLFINKYKGQSKFITNKYGNWVLSSNKDQMVGHNACGFDNCIVLNSLSSCYKCKKKNKISTGIIKLSLNACSVIGNNVEIPKNKKFVCSKCHKSGSSKNIQKNTTYNQTY